MRVTRPIRRRQLLSVEQLEDRTLMSVQPISLADPSRFGITANSSTSYDFLTLPISISSDGQTVAFSVDGNNLVGSAYASSVSPYSYVRNLASGTTIPAAVTPSGQASSGGAGSALVSADGRYVTFESTGTDLTTDTYPNSDYNVFRRDLQTGETKLVTVTPSGNQAGNGGSNVAGISPHGRYVAFITGATDIVANDVNNIADLDVRDMVTGVTHRPVDVGQFSEISAYTNTPLFTSDEQYMFFETGNALVAGDTNNAADIYRYDLQTGALTLVTVNPDGNAANGNTLYFNITPDGRYVVFCTDATDLRSTTSPDPVGREMFVRDMQSGTTTMVSVAPNGTIGRQSDGGDGGSVSQPYISDDGRYIAWKSQAANLTSIAVPDAIASQLYERDMQTGQTVMVTVDPTGTAPASYPGSIIANAGVALEGMTPDGGTIIFSSTATNLTATSNSGQQQIFLRDMPSETTRMLTLNEAGTAGANGISGETGDESTGPASGYLSRDGSRFLFDSDASDLIAGDRNGSEDIFVYDLQANKISPITAHDPSLPDAFMAGGNLVQASPDGRFVLYTSTSYTNPVGSSQYGNLYLADRTTGTTTLVSIVDAAGHGDQAYNPKMTPDGHVVVFNGSDFKRVYVRDVQAGTTTVLQMGTDQLDNPEISADGRYIAFVDNGHLKVYDRQTATYSNVDVTPTGSMGDGTVSEGGFVFSPDNHSLAFASTSTNLTAAANPNHTHNLFLRDLTAGTTQLVSVSTTGAAGNGDTGDYSSIDVSFDGDGGILAFTSQATNLATGSVSGGVYVRNLTTNTTQYISGSGDLPQLNATGRYLAYRGVNFKAFRIDLQTHTVGAVDVSTSGTIGNGLISGLTISADGQTVAFVDSSTNLVASFATPPGGPFLNVYARDFQAGTTTLLSVNLSGTGGVDDAEYSGNRTSPTLSLTADGSRVFFDTPAGNLYAGDTNADYDVYTTSTVAPNGSIHGTVFQDLNSDGVENGRDAGLAGVTVFIDGNNNGKLDGAEKSVQTDAQGNYAFNGLDIGTYVIQQVAPATAVQTRPAPGTGYSVTLTQPGQSATGRDFADHLPLADLTVPRVTMATSPVEPGLDFTVNWTVTNTGTATAGGAWQDAVYLTVDGQIDARSVLVDVVPYTAGLASGASYTGTTTKPMPALPLGTYQVIVVTARRFGSAEDPSATNVGISSPFTTTVPVLALGTSLTDQFDHAGQSRFYRIDVPSGGTLKVSLSGPAGSANAIALRNGAVPTVDSADARAEALTPDVTLLQPIAGGSYFLEVHNRFGPAGGGAFTLTATLATALGLISVAPVQVSNGGAATVTVHGVELTPGTRLELIAPNSNVLESIAQTFTDATTMTAQFDLTGQPTGSYSVRATGLGGTHATLNAALTVVPGTGPQLEVHLSGPDYTVRALQPRALSLFYQNLGGADAPAPLLRVTTPTGTWLGTTLSDIFGGHVVSLLGIGQSGLPGVLGPGELIGIPIYFEAPAGPYEFASKVVTVDDTTPLDWTEVASYIDTTVTSGPNWPAVLAQLQMQVGSTYGDFVRTLDRDVDLLPPTMGDLHNIATVFDIEVRTAVAAIGTSLRGSLQTSDARVPIAAQTVVLTNVLTGDRFTASSLNDGSFVFDTLPAGNFILTVDGRLLQSTATVTVTAGQAVVLPSITLIRGAGLSGQVTALEDGRPIVGATVQLFQDDGTGMAATTADDGSFQMTAIVPGSYQVTVTAPGRARTTLGPLTLTDTDQIQNATLTLAAMIQGKVIAASGGPATPTVNITARRLDPVSSAIVDSFTTTAAFGSEFTVSGLAAGTYQLAITATGYARQDLAPVSVAAGGIADLGPITLPVAATITGTVISDLADVSAASSLIGLFDGDTARAYVYADATGNFTLNDIQPGSYTLQLAHDKGFVEPLPVTVTAAQTLSGVTLELKAGRTLTGMVTDSGTGDPLGGASVLLITAQGPVAETSTDSAGSFEFVGLGPGTYQVTLHVPGANTIQSVQVDSIDGAPMQANLQTSFAAQLSGHVQTATGQPVSPAIVGVWENGQLIGTTATDSTGLFAFQFARGGTFDLRAEGADGAFDPVTSISVQPGGHVVQDLVAGNETLQVQVQDPQDVLNGAVASLSRVLGGQYLGAGTQILDGSGTAIFANLPAGDYVVNVTNGAGRGATESVTVLAGVTNSLTVVLAPLAGLHGVVRDATNQPIATATVVLTDPASPSSSFALNADTSGAYDFTGVAPGTYDLTAYADGFLAATITGVTVNATNPTLDIALAIGQSDITGLVTDATGHAVPLGTITVLDDAGHQVGQATVAGDGSYHVHTAVGSNLTLEFAANGYTPLKVTGLSASAGGTTNVPTLQADAVLDPQSTESGASGMAQLHPHADGNGNSSTMVNDPSLMNPGNPATQYFHTTPPDQQPLTVPVRNPNDPNDLGARLAAQAQQSEAAFRAMQAHQAYLDKVKQELSDVVLNDNDYVPTHDCMSPDCLRLLAQVNDAIQRRDEAKDNLQDATDDLQGALFGGVQSWEIDVGKLAGTLAGIGLAIYATKIIPGLAPTLFGSIGMGLLSIIRNIADLQSAGSGVQAAATGDGIDVNAIQFSRSASYGGSILLGLNSLGFKVLEAGKNKLPNPFSPWISILLSAYRLFTADPFAEIKSQAKIIHTKEEQFKTANQQMEAARVRLANVLAQYLRCLHQHEAEDEQRCDCPPGQNCDPQDAHGDKTDDTKGQGGVGSDPNALDGPGGFGPQHFVAPAAVLPYTVSFENDPAKATAAVQEVFVTLQLDPNLDWSTFQFGDLGFGATTVPVAAGQQAFEAGVDTTSVDGSALHVDISGNLDLQTGIVTWTFRSVDPTTGLLPYGVDQGLLPIDDATGRGEGFVTYTVQPKASLATGTVLTAQASIVFDTNAPLSTAAFTNTIDAGVPSSQVYSLPGSSLPNFIVNWSGQDNANESGVGLFDIYVSDNGGAWRLWQNHTPDTSAVFPGVLGHRYAFGSIAIDNVGNREVRALSIGAQTQTASFEATLTEPADTTKPAIEKISDLLNSHYGDADGAKHTKPGIAISATSGDGTWQFSTNGKSWTGVGPVAANHVLRLPQADSLRFLPGPGFIGEADLLFEAWDGSFGAAGTYADAGSVGYGGASPFSASAAMLAVTVASAGTAPRWMGTSSLFTPMLPNAAPTTGNTVASVFGPLFADATTTTAGIAVVALTGTAGGSWQFSTNGGTSWTAFGRVSSASARLLSGTDRIRFMPNKNFAGIATLKANAWDGTGTDGGTGNLAGNGATGGNTHFSSTLLTAALPVNRAPGFKSTSVVLPAARENTTAVVSVAKLLANASDPDRGALKGVAIVDAGGPGVWTFSIDKGKTWSALPAVAEASALLLSSSGLLRFAPAVNQTGSATIRYHSWDETTGTPGNLFAITVTGGSAAFSTAIATATLAITAVPPAPVWLGTTATLTPVLPAPNQSNGDRLSDVFGPYFAGTATGIAITALTGSANGTWQASTDDGQNWKAIGSVSVRKPTLVAGTARIRFLPTKQRFLGTVTLQALAWDGGTKVGTTRLTATGLVNTAPTLTP
jgi:hypothetical protein